MVFNPKKILVPVALDPGDDFLLAKQSLLTSCDLALKFNSKIVMLHLSPTVIAGGGAGIDVSGKIYNSLTQALHEREALSKQQMEELQKLALLKGINIEGRVVDSIETIPNVICHSAEELGCDLIVMASHGRHGLSKLFFGSVAEKVINKTKIPVLVLHATE